MCGFVCNFNALKRRPVRRILNDSLLSIWDVEISKTLIFVFPLVGRPTQSFDIVILCNEGMSKT